MCGLYGWQLDANKVSVAQRAIAAAILTLYNEERGRESWGWYDGRERYRGVGQITHTDEATKMAQSDFVLGHTRLATMGSLTVENCHPFKLGHIVGAHNGMVYNAWELDYQYGRDFDVDSMHIFQHINEKLELDDIEAYGAITYVNTKHRGRVHLGRFNGGVLSVYRIRDMKTGNPVGVMWSSESRVLDKVASMTGLDMVEVNVEADTFYEIWGGDIWSVKNNHINISEMRRYSKSDDDTGKWSSSTQSSSPYSSAYATAYEKEHKDKWWKRGIYNDKSWCRECSSYNDDSTMCFLCDRCYFCCACVQNGRLGSVDDRLSYVDVRAWDAEDKRADKEAEESGDPKEPTTVKTISTPVVTDPKDGTQITCEPVAGNNGQVPPGEAMHNARQEKLGSSYIATKEGGFKKITRALHLPFTAPIAL